MLPGVGPRPKHQKMQLEAVNVSFLSREGAPLGSGFPRASPHSPGLSSQPPFPRVLEKGGWRRLPHLGQALCSNNQWGSSSGGFLPFSLWASRRLSYCPGCKMCL